jgi:hypothetical protein
VPCRRTRFQFQNRSSLQRFLQYFGNAAQCARALERWRWPRGFVCPCCGHAHAPVRLRTRGLLQCRHCHHQTSLTAGTIFAGSRPLRGVIEVDDAYWGGERHDAKPGRGSPNKVPFIVALARNHDGHPLGLRMGKVAGFRTTEAERFARRHFDPNAIALSDDLACFRGIARAGFEHQPVVTGGGHRSMQLPEFKWLNTVLGNVKNAMHGTYHHASGKHLPRYLGEFCYRFNCRSNPRHAPAPGLGRCAYTAHAAPAVGAG